MKIIKKYMVILAVPFFLDGILNYSGEVSGKDSNVIYTAPPSDAIDRAPSLLAPPAISRDNSCEEEYTGLGPIWSKSSIPYNLKNRSYWAFKYFTNPKKHNPKKFLYLVHGLKINVGEKTLLPDKFLKGPLPLSLSLINEDKKETWFPCGFIMQVPPINIFASHFADMGVPGQFFTGWERTVNLIKELNKIFPLKTPKEILKNTRSFKSSIEQDYNEIFAIGRVEVPAGFSQVEIGGIFEKVSKVGGGIKSLCPEENRQALKKYHETHPELAWVVL